MNIVKLLINNGANVNQTDRVKQSALHYACMRFHFQIALELITNGCNLNTKSMFNYSPLKYLLENKQYNIAKFLVDSGCELTNEEEFLEGNTNNTQIDQQFLIWMRSYKKNPPKLLNICRNIIRSNLGTPNMHKKLETINVPKDMVTFLQMKFLY